MGSPGPGQPDIIMITFVISITLALSVSFLCSLLEACLLSLTPGQIAELCQSRPRVGRIWQNIKRDIEASIAAILTLNTTAHTIGATIAGAKFAVLFGDNWIGLFSAVLTYFMLQFTEILPKSCGVRFARELATPFAYLLPLLTRVLHPIVWFVRLVNRPFEPKQTDEGDVPTSIEELTALARLARVEHDISDHQERIITGVAALSHQAVRDIMIPVTEITFLSTQMSLSDAIITAHLDPHTRFPVTAGTDTDQVLGYVNFKELIYRVRTNPADPTLTGIIRPVHFLSPGTTCVQALRIFIDEHVHMAVVRDARGTVLGLITLEDVMEELLGKLGDEFERLPKMMHALADGVWIMGGGVPVNRAMQALKINGPDNTLPLAAWMTEAGKQAAALGQVRTHEGRDFIVRRVRRGRVFEVLVTPEGKRPPDFPSTPTPAGDGHR